MGAKLFVITLGFDESHAIRSLIVHNKISEDDFVLFILPKDGLKNERTRSALKTISEVVKYSVTKDKFYDVLELYVPDKENPESSFYRSLALMSNRIMRICREISASEIIFDISGGMRILTVIALLSAYIVGTRDISISVRVEMETEDKIMHVRIPTKIFGISLGSWEVLILETLDKHGPLGAKDLIYTTKMKRTTFYYTIRDLLANGLIENRERKYYITEIGRAILYIHTGRLTGAL